MISAWTRHLKEGDEKERFKNSVLGSKIVLERLNVILKELEDEQARIERNTQIYESPNWAFKQAHLNGFSDCLNKVKKIITLDEQSSS